MMRRTHWAALILGVSFCAQAAQFNLSDKTSAEEWVSAPDVVVRFLAQLSLPKQCQLQQQVSEVIQMCKESGSATFSQMLEMNRHYVDKAVTELRKEDPTLSVIEAERKWFLGRYQPMLAGVLGDAKTFVTRSRLSARVKEAIANALAPVNFKLVENRDEDGISNWNAFIDNKRATLQLNRAFVLTPVQDHRGILRHEVGHYISFLLQGGREHCTVSITPSPSCREAKKVQALLTDQDVRLLEEMRRCIDRNFIEGELRSVLWNKNANLSQLLNPDLILEKREEYFADYMQRAGARSDHWQQSLNPYDYRAYCKDSEKREANALGNNHGDFAFRIVNLLNTGPLAGSSAGVPPLACEEIL